MDVFSQAGNTYSTHTKISKRPWEQVPMHTVEQPALLWTALSHILKSYWMHQSHHTIFISGSTCTKRQGVFLAGDSPCLLFHIACQITAGFTVAEGNGQWDPSKSGQDKQTLLELPSFSVSSTTLAFWHQPLTYTSSLLKPTHFTHLLSLFALSAWPESTELHEAPYTVGGQQQPLNILQRLNETWINLFSVSFQNK